MTNVRRMMMGVPPADTADKPGTLWTWGLNDKGQLGLGDKNVHRSSPVQVGSLTNWLGGTEDVCETNRMTVKDDGTLWAWGNNEHYGQLGMGDVIYRSSPVQVGSLTDWAHVAANNSTTAAVKTDGTLWTWGSNSDGVLGRLVAGGIGWGKASSSPVQIGSLTDWSTLTFSGSTVLAIKTDGTLWVWGNNANGQLGVGSTISYSSPIQLGSLTTWADISGGDSFVLGVTTGGTLFAWGKNTTWGMLGLGDLVNRSSPVQVGSLTTWASTSLGHGGRFSTALTTSGEIFTWGRGQYGEGGHGDVVNRSSPVQVGSLTTWKRISAGTRLMGAIKTDGTLWTWGSYFRGGLAQNNDISYSSPTQVGSSTDWISIGMGDVGGTATRTP